MEWAAWYGLAFFALFCAWFAMLGRMVWGAPEYRAAFIIMLAAHLTDVTAQIVLAGNWPPIMWLCIYLACGIAMAEYAERVRSPKILYVASFFYVAALVALMGVFSDDFAPPLRNARYYTDISLFTVLLLQSFALAAAWETDRPNSTLISWWMK